MSDEQPSEFDHERWLAAIAPQLPYKIEIPPPLEEDDEKPAADDSAGDALCRRPTTVEEREAFYRDREEHGRRIDPATAEVMSEWGLTSDPYGIIDDLADEERQIGRVYFARAPGGVWVHFGDLPNETAQVLHRRGDISTAVMSDEMLPF